MGRKKIEIVKKGCRSECIAVFGKRHQGLIKKAYELSELCGVDVALITYAPTGDLKHFSSHPRYLSFSL
jgi:SRF-type transcription factor (DNA-binding and dimerisation domain)